MEQIHKEQDAINRVKCIVDNCQFWESGDHCQASMIEVRAESAHTSEETACATFQPKEW